MADEPKHEKNVPEKAEKNVGEKPEKNVGELQKGEPVGEKERGGGELGRQAPVKTAGQPPPAHQAKTPPTKPQQATPAGGKGGTQGSVAPQELKCENCGESFTTEQAMAEHTREKHAGTSNP